MTQLTSSQCKHLRGLAHPLKPIVLVGREGVSPALVANTAQALADHELIKVRFNAYQEERRELAAELALAADAQLAGLVGHVAILFRPHDDPARRRIVLPV